MLLGFSPRLAPSLLLLEEEFRARREPLAARSEALHGPARTVIEHALHEPPQTHKSQNNQQNHVSMTSVFHELSNSLKTNFTDGKRLQVGEEQSDTGFIYSYLAVLSHLSVSTAG